MRLAGDPDSCAALSRELERSAAQVADAGAYPERSTLSQDLWSGVAAVSWQSMATRSAVRAERLAEQLVLAGRALRSFTDQLVELQLRAARLASRATDEGLVMDADGGIAPVPLLYGPYTDPVMLAEQQRALHRAEIRSGLLAEVASLQADEDELHGRLVRELRSAGGLGGIGLRPPPAPEEREGNKGEDEGGGGGSWWEPDWWDATAAAGVLRTTPLKELSLSGLGPAAQGWAMLRTVPGMAVVTGAVGVAGDVREGYSLEGAVLKETVVGASSVGAGFAAGAAASIVFAPVAAPVVAGVLVGAAVGYGVGKAWDAVAQPEPDEDKSKDKGKGKGKGKGKVSDKGRSDEADARAARPRSRAQVGPAVRPGRAVPFDPTCGQGPVLSQVS